jgi:hypothetical protein
MAQQVIGRGPGKLYHPAEAQKAAGGRKEKQARKFLLAHRVKTCTILLLRERVTLRDQRMRGHQGKRSGLQVHWVSPTQAWKRDMMTTFTKYLYIFPCNYIFFLGFELMTLYLESRHSST